MAFFSLDPDVTSAPAPQTHAPIELSPQQEKAVQEISQKLKSGQPLVTLGGYAGSGKSTIIPSIIRDPRKTAFCCYTGKASQVLRSKLGAAGMASSAGYVGTIHGLIYELADEKDTGEMTWRKRKALGGENSRIETLVVDEASMVGSSILQDLKSYNVQILAVGDPAQLPPVQDESVMMNPDFTLTEVHRQAKDSPIIRIATHIRQEGTIPDYVEHITYPQATQVTDGMNPLDWTVLTRSNRARVFFNEQINGNTPKAGDVVICLKNYWQEGVYNGLRGTIMQVPEDMKGLHTSMRFDFPDAGKRWLSDVNLKQFNREKSLTPKQMADEFKLMKLGMLFDFGTALTVHKAQGSGFHTVLISPEEWPWNRSEKEDWRKWLYTAVTRATDKLYFLPKW